MRSLHSNIIVSIDQLRQEPYASIVCYPRTNPTEIQSRIEELQQLRVEALEFRGKTSAANVPVLGKGYVGVVVVAHVCEENAALKMRRSDADRENLEHEADLLAKANSSKRRTPFFCCKQEFSFNATH